MKFFSSKNSIVINANLNSAAISDLIRNNQNANTLVFQVENEEILELVLNVDLELFSKEQFKTVQFILSLENNQNIFDSIKNDIFTSIEHVKNHFKNAETTIIIRSETAPKTNLPRVFASLEDFKEKTKYCVQGNVITINDMINENTLKEIKAHYPLVTTIAINIGNGSNLEKILTAISKENFSALDHIQLSIHQGEYFPFLMNIKKEAVETAVKSLDPKIKISLKNITHTIGSYGGSLCQEYGDLQDYLEKNDHYRSVLE